MTNVILQSFMLGLVNINVYANFYQNIPYGSRVKGNLHFLTIWTSAKPRLMENLVSIGYQVITRTNKTSIAYYIISIFY